MTFYPKPIPWMSVNNKISTPLLDSKVLVVACPTWGSLDFVPRAIPIIGASVFTAGLRNGFHASLLPLNTFFIVFLNADPSISKSVNEKNICFWHFHLEIGHTSCTLSKLPLLFKSHHARFHIGLEGLFLQFADFWIFSPLVCWFSF